MTKFHEKLNRSRVHVQAKIQENLLTEKSFNTDCQLCKQKFGEVLLFSNIE